MTNGELDRLELVYSGEGDADRTIRCLIAEVRRLRCPPVEMCQTGGRGFAACVLPAGHKGPHRPAAVYEHVRGPERK